MDKLSLLQRKNKLLKLLLIINQYKTGIRKKRCKKRRRIWIRPSIVDRENKSEASTLVKEMSLRDLTWYYNYTRMLPERFMELLELVGPIVQKQETNLRQPIPPNIRLLITLRYIC